MKIETKTKFPVHFEGSNFHNVDAEAVRVIDEFAGDGQGVRYIPQLKIAVFRSNKIEDIFQVELNCGWSNTTNAHKLEPGYTIYVIPNAKIRAKCPTVGGVRYTLTTIPYREEYAEKDWESDKV